MKTIVKFFSINDGKQKQLVNRDFLHIEETVRIETIVSEFLNEGYTIKSCMPRVIPAINKPGAYSFYLGGWDIVFTKQIEDDEEDRSDELMQRAIAKVQSQEEELDDENDDDDDDWQYDVEDLVEQSDLDDEDDDWQYDMEDLVEECDLDDEDDEDDEIEKSLKEENSGGENGN